MIFRVDCSYSTFLIQAEKQGKRHKKHWEETEEENFIKDILTYWNELFKDDVKNLRL